MAYQVAIRPAVDRIIAQLPNQVRQRIAQRLQALSVNPRPPGSVKLAGRDAYRIRIGDYRVIYMIYDDQLLVIVVDAGHRRDVYRRR
jgi:mRNA interferase RelE/StbE